MRTIPKSYSSLDEMQDIKQFKRAIEIYAADRGCYGNRQEGKDDVEQSSVVSGAAYDSRDI
jgi:hypothetical protein